MTPAERQRQTPQSLWRMAAPWLTYPLLGGAALLGLFAARGGDGTYIAGLITAGAALILLAWHVKEHSDGSDRLLPPLAVTGSTALLLSVVILGVLALAGLFLAARSDGTLHDAGLAGFVVCLGLVLYEVKGYFDRQEQ
jgi:hypothetical protein